MLLSGAIHGNVERSETNDDDCDVNYTENGPACQKAKQGQQYCIEPLNKERAQNDKPRICQGNILVRVEDVDEAVQRDGQLTVQRCQEKTESKSVTDFLHDSTRSMINVVDIHRFVNRTDDGVCHRHADQENRRISLSQLSRQKNSDRQENIRERSNHTYNATECCQGHHFYQCHSIVVKVTLFCQRRIISVVSDVHFECQVLVRFHELTKLSVFAWNDKVPWHKGISRVVKLTPGEVKIYRVQGNITSEMKVRLDSLRAKITIDFSNLVRR